MNRVYRVHSADDNYSRSLCHLELPSPINKNRNLQTIQSPVQLPGNRGLAHQHQIKIIQPANQKIILQSSSDLESRTDRNTFGVFAFKKKRQNKRKVTRQTELNIIQVEEADLQQTLDLRAYASDSSLRFYDNNKMTRINNTDHESPSKLFQSSILVTSSDFDHIEKLNTSKMNNLASMVSLSARDQQRNTDFTFNPIQSIHNHSTQPGEDAKTGDHKIDTSSEHLDVTRETLVSFTQPKQFY